MFLLDMQKIFGLPILIAILLASIFPYIGLSLINISVYLLIFLMYLSISHVNLNFNFKKGTLTNLFNKDLLVGILLLFIIYPLIQFLLAKLLIKNQYYVYGLTFASLTPIAIVAPYFTSLHQGNKEFSFSFMLVSMVICPFLAPIILYLLFNGRVDFNLFPIIKILLLVFITPLFILVITNKWLPSLKKTINKHQASLNSVCLSLLIFILIGAAYGKMQTNYISLEMIIKILLIAIFQDFVVYFLSLKLLSKFKFKKTISISVSMKNIAIAANILLFYTPQAAIPVCLIFVIHALFFNYLGFAGSKLP